MARRVFFSFHFDNDYSRTQQVRNIGAIEGNKPVSKNDWEQISNNEKGDRDKKIAKWIDDNLYGKSCTVVLVGQDTADRKWINYEIVKSWNAGMGVVGIRIHGLKNLEGNIAKIGNNPFDYIPILDTEKKLSSIVKCYNPPGSNSKERYAWIRQNLVNAIEEAIEIRNGY